MVQSKDFKRSLFIEESFVFEWDQFPLELTDDGEYAIYWYIVHVF